MQTESLPRRWQIGIVIAVALVFVLKITLAWRTYGTNDILTWEQDLVKLNSQGPLALYRDGVQAFSATGKPYNAQPFIHPPFIIHALQFWGFLATITHIPLRFWMRLTCALADIGSLIVIWQIGKQSPGWNVRPVMLALFAVCPISILLSGFHGNTDPIMMFFVLLAIYSIESKRPAVVAGLLMGLALSIKIVPVILIPAVLLYLSRFRDRCNFTIALCVTFVLAGLPYWLQDPVFIIDRLTNYTSVTGFWGLSAILTSYHQGKHITLLSVLAAAIFMNSKTVRVPLFAQCGLIISLFLFLTPGFGVQYLIWLAPWVVYLSLPVAALYYFTAGIFMFSAYTHWSGGIPWYFANSLEVPGWSTAGAFFCMACWAVTGIVFFMFIEPLLHGRKIVLPISDCSVPGTRGLAD